MQMGPSALKMPGLIFPESFVQNPKILFSLFGAFAVVNSPEKIPGKCGHLFHRFFVKAVSGLQHPSVINGGRVLKAAQNMLHSPAGIIQGKRRKILRLFRKGEVCAIRKPEIFPAGIKRGDSGKRTLEKAVCIVHNEIPILRMQFLKYFIRELSIIINDIEIAFWFSDTCIRAEEFL